MDIFLYSKTPDLSYAAASLADLQALVAALADPADAENAATIARVTSAFPALVQGDTAEPLTIWSYDDATGGVSSWITDASVTLAAGLGQPDPAGAWAYASTTSFSISGSSRVGSLALNTTALQSALSLCRGGHGIFTLHLRKSSAGATETVARLSVLVQAGVLSGSPTDVVYTPAYGPVHLPAITSLTGGGSTALDGLLAATAAWPVGSLVFLTIGDIAQPWKLKAGSQMEDGLTIVTPDNASSYHWKLQL